MEKPYEFRVLNATDIVPMATIIGKIGINQFGDCLRSETVKEAIMKAQTGDIDQIAGISVMLEVANTVLFNLERCEADIFRLLSRTSDLTVEQVKAMDIATFFEMVMDFASKSEFKDFFEVASKYVKRVM